MSLFNFGKRKQPEATPPQPINSSPRDHHYAFAHVVFRTIALENPLACLSTLASDRSQEFLQFAYDATCETCQEYGKPDFSVNELKVHLGRAGKYPCAVIQMPPPVEVTEAYLVALVALLDTTEETPSELDNVEARYFTLEKGMSFDDSEQTVLCEWSDSTHSNYGSGPEPTVPAFIQQIMPFIDR